MILSGSGDVSKADARYPFAINLGQDQGAKDVGTDESVKGRRGIKK